MQSQFSTEGGVYWKVKGGATSCNKQDNKTNSLHFSGKTPFSPAWASLQQAVVASPEAFGGTLRCWLYPLGTTPAVLKRWGESDPCERPSERWSVPWGNTIRPNSAPYFSRRRSIPVRPLISHEPFGWLREFSRVAPMKLLFLERAGGYVFRMFNPRRSQPVWFIRAVMDAALFRTG